MRALPLVALVAGLVAAAGSAGAGGGPPRVAGCPVFGADSAWNRRVDALPVAPGSARSVAAIGLDEHLHADFVLTALKEYGMVVADNGSAWYVSGVPSPRWSNDDLHALHRVPGSAFEVVDPAAIRP